MTLTALPGAYAFLGPSPVLSPIGTTSTVNCGAVNGAVICVGRMMTSDGGSHTIDTTGSSSIGWIPNGITFASGSTTVKVGIAAVDTSNGQPGRAVNSSGAITFDVAASFTGGGGGITDATWNTSVPTSGTKTIANGDLVAVAVQMTARGGSDIIPVTFASSGGSDIMRPAVTAFNGASYTRQTGLMPNFFVTFADGATGWIQGGDIVTNVQARAWNSGSATKEYGQLYQMPFPMKICGLYGWGVFGNDLTMNLYSDPLGTPTVQKACTIVQKTLSFNSGFWYEEFSSPYTTTANQPVGAVFTPGASNISAYYKTLGFATHRVSDPWGTSGYGISRASGAFASTNSNKDHYYVGLLISAFDDATGGGGGSSGIVIGS